MRRSPSRQRSQQCVDRILDAAAAILIDESVDNLTVTDIAKRAKVMAARYPAPAFEPQT